MTSEERAFKGLLECPFRRGYVEFQYRSGYTVADLLRSIEERWGASYGWATSKGFAPDPGHPRERYGRAEGWIVAVEDQAGAYIALPGESRLPEAPPASKRARRLPKNDRWYPGAVEHGCYNWETFGRPDPEKPFRMPLTRTYELPDKSSFDICLIALVAVSGG